MTQKHIQMKHTGPNGEIFDVFPKTKSELVQVKNSNLDDVISGINSNIESKANASHTHKASEVTFTDGYTFQQKLDNGSLKGETGERGLQGPQGIQGPKGEQGVQGPKGDTGLQGEKGLKGDKGDTGLQGPKGDKGDTGAQGLQGPQGIKGDKGDKGDQGNPFVIKKSYASISDMNKDFSNSALSLYDFVIINSSINDEDNSKLFMKGEKSFEFVTDLSGATGIQGPKGDKGEQGIQGIQGEVGPQGQKGDKGDQGITPTIKVGTVTTSNPGTNVSVTAQTSGTTTTFNFSIPKGETGAQGIQGAVGPKGETGAQGPQGLKGETGDKGEKGDKGDKGDIGLTGPQGPKGDIGLTGATGVSMRLKGAWSSSISYVNNSSYIDLVTANGNTYACKVSHTNQSVTNTTYWELVAKKGDQGIQGEKGLKGDKGETGAQGPQGIQGLKGDTGAAGKDGLTTSVTVGNVKYTHENGNINLPAYPTLSSLGAAAASHGTHVTYSTASPSANGSASAGTSSSVARADHVHPLQTTISGNAGTATKLQTARTIAVAGDISGSVNFDGSQNVSIETTLKNSGVTSGSYGPSSNATVGFGGTITIPQVTVDSKGRVTSASSKTITLPSNPDTDTKVTNTLDTTSKAYITATTYATSNTSTQIFDTGVYLDTEEGSLTARIFNGDLNGNALTATNATRAESAALADNATKANSATKATQDNAGQQIDKTYIKDLSISGTTITYTKGDGSKSTIVTQDTNTDTKVTNNLATTTKAYITGTTSATSNTGTQVFDTGVYLDTEEGTLVASTFRGNLSGNATSANTANSANTATRANSAALADKATLADSATLADNATTANSATKALQDNAGQQIDKTYIKNLSVNGTTITYTKGDGTTGTIATQDTNTDNKVTNTLNLTAKAYITGTTSSSTNTGTQVFDTGVYLDTTEGTLVATTFKGSLSGNAATSTKATQDSVGQQINKTYIKDLSINGTTITYTKGDGTTATITTQDTNTDNKVTNTLNATAKAYITGTTSSSTNTGDQVFDTGVYLDTTAGHLTATQFNGTLNGNAKTATTATTASTCTGNAATSTKLAKAVTINGASFDGSSNITTSVWGAARNINIADSDSTNAGLSVSVDGSKAITLNLPSTIKADITGDLDGNAKTATTALNCSGNAATATTALACTGNSATATKLAKAITLNGSSFDGSSNITTSLWGAARDINIADSDSTNLGEKVSVNGSGSVTLKLPSVIKANLSGNATSATTATTCSGNASTATTLQTSRKINGTSFNGSADITTALWGSARNITISDNDSTNTGSAVSVDGSKNVSLKLPSTIKASLSGNASTATKLQSAKTISINGAVLGSASFDGSSNITITTTANDITNIVKSLKVTTDWMDTGIAGTNLSTGTYAVQMIINDSTNTGQVNEYYSGTMSWFNGTCSSNGSDEILLHKAGATANDGHVFLRTTRVSSGSLKLQIASLKAFSAASDVTFIFKKLI